MLKIESLKDGVKISEMKSPKHLKIEQVGTYAVIETDDSTICLNNISIEQIEVKKDDNKNVIIVNQEEGK